MYGVFPYFLAKVTMDTPVLIISPFVASNIMYWALSYEYTFGQYLKFYFSLFMLGQAAASIGYFLSASFENPVIGLSIAPLCVMPMILFGGLMSNNNDQA